MITETYLERSQTTMMVIFAKTVNGFSQLTIFTEKLHHKVWIHLYGVIHLVRTQDFSKN